MAIDFQDIKNLYPIAALVISVIGCFLGLAFKKPKMYIGVVEPLLVTAFFYILVFCFGALIMGMYASYSFAPLSDPAKSVEVDAVKNMMFIIPFGGFIFCMFFLFIQVCLVILAKKVEKFNQSSLEKE